MAIKVAIKLSTLILPKVGKMKQENDEVVLWLIQDDLSCMLPGMFYSMSVAPPRMLLMAS